MDTQVAGLSSARRQDLAVELAALDEVVAATREAFRRRIDAEFALLGNPGPPGFEAIPHGTAIALTGELANFTYAVVGDEPAATWLARRCLEHGPDDDTSLPDLAEALHGIARQAAGTWQARRREQGERYQPGLPLFLRGRAWLSFFSKGVDAISQRLAGPEGIVLQVVLVWQRGVKPGGVPLLPTHPPAVSTAGVDRPTTLLQEAARAVVETCEIQLGLNLAIAAAPTDPREAAVDFGSSIALTSAAGGSWNLAVMASRDSCGKLTRILFAMDPDEEPTPEDLADGVGELANVAAGMVKASRLEAGEKVQIGLPLFTEGRGCIDVVAPGVHGLAQRLTGPDGIEVQVIITWQDDRPDR